MLDIKLIRKDPQGVKAALSRRGKATGIDELLALDAERRNCLAEVDKLKNRKNVSSRNVGSVVSAGDDARELVEEMRRLNRKIKEYDTKVVELDNKIAILMNSIPNIPHESVKSGGYKKLSMIVKEFGQRSVPDFNLLPHWELGENLDILDFVSAAKMTGSNFPLYKGLGARLERALYKFMLDLHVEVHGYTEIIPPYMVNRDSMLGTGQLPKLEDDMYLCEADDLFLIPTAEVPLVNMHREEIIDEKILPISYVAYTPCFRREAGSYGKDTRGLIRVHQFDKVEMVKFARPEESYDELEKMLGHAEEVVKRLELPYRVFQLCAEEISFASTKTYDIEIWAPGIERWLEVASISNCESFQARRAKIRCKKKGEKGTFYPHTLNGSGIALARTFLAILETYQQPDGTVRVPKVLVPYMDGIEVIE
jgi:seryl-tRNA synthetase